MKAAFFRFLDVVQAALKPHSASASLELCTRTLAEQREVRVHGHVFLAFSGAMEVNVCKLPALKFLKWSVPYADTRWQSRHGFNRANREAVGRPRADVGDAAGRRRHHVSREPCARPFPRPRAWRPAFSPACGAAVRCRAAAWEAREALQRRFCDRLGLLVRGPVFENFGAGIRAQNWYQVLGRSLGTTK